MARARRCDGVLRVLYGSTYLVSTEKHVTCSATFSRSLDDDCSPTYHGVRYVEAPGTRLTTIDDRDKEDKTRSVTSGGGGGGGADGRRLHAAAAAASLAAPAPAAAAAGEANV